MCLVKSYIHYNSKFYNSVNLYNSINSMSLLNEIKNVATINLSAFSKES